MNVIEITLENGTPFKVRQLGLFELDNLMPDSLGPFTYEVEIMGKKHDVEFKVERYETPPEKPAIPESQIKPNTPEADDLLDYQLYQAAILHNKRRLERMSAFYNDVKNYIIKNACVDDPNLILTMEDWRRVYDAALVPQLTLDIIVNTLRNTYAAKFNGQEIFDALERTKKTHGSYDTIKLWENKLMIKMQKTEVQYSMIPLEERARKVCAMFLDDIMSYLEMDLESKLNDRKTKT